MGDSRARSAEMEAEEAQSFESAQSAEYQRRILRIPPPRPFRVIWTNEYGTHVTEWRNDWEAVQEVERLERHGDRGRIHGPEWCDCCDNKPWFLAPVRPMPDTLSLAALRLANLHRCNETFHPEGGIAEWGIEKWILATFGELGEAANLVKKTLRGEDIPREAIAKELADVLIYLDLVAARLNIDLAAATRSKFNEVSVRVNSPIKL